MNNRGDTSCCCTHWQYNFYPKVNKLEGSMHINDTPDAELLNNKFIWQQGCAHQVEPHIFL